MSTQKKLKAVEDTKEVAHAQTTALSAVEKEAAQVSAGTEVVASDVLIPRLLLMQGISPLVTSRKAQIGDMVRSTTGEKLGNPDKPLVIVPLTMINSWISFEDTGEGQPQFRGQIPRGVTRRDANGLAVETNEGLPWDYKGPNGEDMFRRKAITLYALVPSDVAAYQAEIARATAEGEAPDLSKNLLPVVITFQSTSFKHAGRKCASFFNDVKKLRASPFNYSITLECREEKKGKNAWYILDFAKVESSIKKGMTDEAKAEWRAVQQEAASWVTILSKGGVKTDDSMTDDADMDEAPAGSKVAEMEV